MEKIYSYQKVNTAGEVTAVITTPVPLKQQAALSRQIMDNDTNIEQVAFVTTSSLGQYRLRMMGGELSVNGAVAGAFILMKQLKQNNVQLFDFSFQAPITATLKTNKITAKFPISLVRSINGNDVKLANMTYCIVKNIPKKPTVTAKRRILLRTLAKTTPAAGIVYFEKNTVAPLIYVKATQSYVWEQACGSGSIAYALLSGLTRVKQPSGEFVSIRITKDEILYKARATIYSERR